MRHNDFFEHLRQIARAFKKYGLRGFFYIWMRYVVAQRILSRSKPLEMICENEDLSMHMLVGARDFLMGVWSLASFFHVMPSDCLGELVIHSDGTLTKKHISVLKTLFPSVRVESTEDFLSTHYSLLERYPTLKRFRKTYKKFQIRIIDQYFLSHKKLRLFLDSDLLWFQTPVEIIESIRKGVPTPLMLSNGEYIRMEFTDGSMTDDKTSRPNGGLVLFNQAQLTPERLALFLEKCDYENKRFGDQAWMAWCLRPDMLPEDRYIVKGTITDKIVMRHYTSPQRLKFFFYGLNFVWKDVLKK